MQPGKYFWTRVPYWVLFKAFPAVWGFMRRRWSVGEVFWVAVVLGLVAPLLDVEFSRWTPYGRQNVVSLPVLAVLVCVVYWRIARGQFRTDRRAMLGVVGAGLLWVAGAFGFEWCGQHHVCMGGHMAHPPYPFWNYALDAGWALGIMGAAIWMRFLRVSVFILFMALSAFAISYRFLLGGYGGIYQWLPFLNPN
jgi:hypothetical protein